MNTLFYVISTALPVNLFIFFLFWKSPGFSRKKAVVLTVLNILTKLLVISSFVPAATYIRLTETAFSLITLIIFIRCVPVNPFKLLFTYIMVIDLVAIVRGVSAFLAVKLFHVSPDAYWNALLCLLLYGISFPPMMPFFRSTLQIIHQTDAPKLWRIIWLVPTLTSAVVLFFTNAFHEESVNSPGFLSSRIILLVFVFVIYHVLLRSLELIRRQAALEEQHRQMEHILSLQREQSARLQEHMEEIRRARHDLRHHLQIIRSFLASSDTQALTSYIESYGAALPPNIAMRYCKNYAADALLQYYADRFAKQGTRFSFHAVLPESLPIPDPDLCVILGNLLENAYKACSHQKEGYVQLAVRLTGSRAITLTADNTAPVCPLFRKDGALLSAKHGGVGIGTQSIQSIALRYHGTAAFKWENGIFYSSVFLNPDDIVKNS